jgi:hypothetical protein
MTSEMALYVAVLRGQWSDELIQNRARNNPFAADTPPVQTGRLPSQVRQHFLYIELKIHEKTQKCD